MAARAFRLISKWAPSREAIFVRAECGCRTGLLASAEPGAEPPRSTRAADQHQKSSEAPSRLHKPVADADDRSGQAGRGRDDAYSGGVHPPGAAMLKLVGR